MKSYQFEMNLVVDANNEEEAKSRAMNALINLNEMKGYAPFSCELNLLIDSCQEVEWIDEEDEEDED